MHTATRATEQPVTTTTTRTGLRALAHGAAKGFGTSIAMIRLVRLAHQDAPSTGLDYHELTRETTAPSSH